MLPVRVLNRAHAHALAAMSAEDDEDAAEYASELLVGRVAEHLSGQDVDASVLTEGLLLRRELVEEWVGGGTPLALLLKGGLPEEAGARVRVPGAVVRRAAALAPPSRGGGTSSSHNFWVRCVCTCVMLDTCLLVADLGADETAEPGKNRDRHCPPTTTSRGHLIVSQVSSAAKTAPRGHESRTSGRGICRSWS